MLRQKYQKDSKYLKYLPALLAGIVFGTGVFFWYFFSAGYYSSVAVTFGKYGYPFVTTQLENQSCALVVDIGSRFPLALRRATLV